MNEELIELLTSYGAPLVMVSTFASCLALPIPSSLVMMGAGALAAAGDLPLFSLLLAAFAGAVIGDHAGMMIGRGLLGALQGRIPKRPRATRALAEAQSFLHSRGGIAVLLSRWPLSPLGPYVNVAAGAARVPWRRFTPWVLLGECVWVLLYVGLGYFAATHLDEVLRVASDMTGLLTALSAAGMLGLWLHRMLKHRRRDAGTDGTSADPASLSERTPHNEQE